MNRYCEEFGCGIPQALDDLENAPLLLVREVMDLRAFVQTKNAYDRAKDNSDAPTGPMADRVWAAWGAIAQDSKEAHAQRLGE